MYSRWIAAPLLALSLALGACGGGSEGALEDMENSVEGTELGPDTAGPGPSNGMGAGSIADTLDSPMGEVGTPESEPR